MSSKNGFLYWLSYGNKEKPESGGAANAFFYSETSTGEDHELFVKHLSQPHRPFKKPGISVKQEYELWLKARAKKGSTSTARVSA